MKKATRVLCFCIALIFAMLPLALSATADDLPGMISEGATDTAPAEETSAPAFPEQNQVTLIDQTYESNLEWKGYLNPTRISWGSENGSAWITDTGWSALNIIPAEAMRGADRYTVSMKVWFTSFNPSASATIFGLIYNNQDSTGVFNKNSGTALLRSNSAGAVYLLNGGYVNGSAKYLTTGNTLSGGAGTASQFPLLSAYNGDNADTGCWITLAVDVDKTAKTGTMYINGNKVSTYDQAPDYDSGIYLLLQSNTKVRLDDLTVTDGEGKTLFFEDFETSADSALKLRDENGTNRLTATVDAFGGLSLKDSGWCIYELASLEQMKGATSFTFSAKLRLESFGAGASQLSFRIGQDPAVSKNNINGATNIQISSSAFKLVGGNRTSSGWISEGAGAKKETATDGVIAIGTVFDFTMQVDNVAKTCTVTIKSANGTVTEVYENILTNESNLSMVFQSQASRFYNIKLTATYENPVELFGAQVSTQVGKDYSLRFSSLIRTDDISAFGAVGIRIEAAYGDGLTKTFVGEDTVVYLAISGGEAGVQKTYRATDYGSAYLFCVTIESIPTEGTITFTATPFVKDLDGNTVTYAPGTFTVVNGVIAH